MNWSTEKRRRKHREWLESRNPAEVSLWPLYLGNLSAIIIGIFFVVPLNIATPLDIFGVRQPFFSGDPGELNRMALRMQPTVWSLMVVIGLIQWRIMGPVSEALRRLRAGGPEPSDRARRRLVNLPFILAAVNGLAWIILPTTAAFVLVGGGWLTGRAATAMAIRSTMVGMLSSTISWFIVEAICRRKLIPLFFPDGRLDQVGGFKATLSRRIKLLWLSGTLVPLLVILITLIEVHREADLVPISTVDFSREVLIFISVVTVLFLAGSYRLYGLVVRSIKNPLDDMVEATEQVEQGEYSVRINVVSADAIGRLGDAGNSMIKALGDRERIRTTFGKYVTPEIRDEILSGRIPEMGERRVATVMFADLRGFTSFVEENDAEEVMSGMRAYYTAMHRVIRSHRGLVLQFVGDQIEAAFGVPVAFEDHAEQAVSAALAMRRALAELNHQRSREGRPEFAHGVGIHTGPVLAGNSGSEDQLAYALIGSTVNVASRIQDLTKTWEWDILVSRAAADGLTPGHRLEDGQSCLVKGYSQPVLIYRLVE